MANLTFFYVLKSNIKCAMCKKKNCYVRYHPERRDVRFYDGTVYITRCEKEQSKQEKRN